MALVSNENIERKDNFWSNVAASARISDRWIGSSFWSKLFRRQTYLNVSDRFVKQLQADGKLGEEAGRYVLVLEPDSSSGVLYILLARSFSERSSIHVKELIAAIKQALS